jgi:hypothetical protein
MSTALALRLEPVFEPVTLTGLLRPPLAVGASVQPLVRTPLIAFGLVPPETGRRVVGPDLNQN